MKCRYCVRASNIVRIGFVLQVEAEKGRDKWFDDLLSSTVP